MFGDLVFFCFTAYFTCTDFDTRLITCCRCLDFPLAPVMACCRNRFCITGIAVIVLAVSHHDAFFCACGCSEHTPFTPVMAGCRDLTGFFFAACFTDTFLRTGFFTTDRLYNFPFAIFMAGCRNLACFGLATCFTGACFFTIIFTCRFCCDCPFTPCVLCFLTFGRDLTGFFFTTSCTCTGFLTFLCGCCFFRYGPVSILMSDSRDCFRLCLATYSTCIGLYAILCTGCFLCNLTIIP